MHNYNIKKNVNELCACCLPFRSNLLFFVEWMFCCVGKLMLMSPRIVINSNSALTAFYCFYIIIQVPSVARSDWTEETKQRWLCVEPFVAQTVGAKAAQESISLKPASKIASNVIAPFTSCSGTLHQGGQLPKWGLEFGSSGWMTVSFSTRPSRRLGVIEHNKRHLHCILCIGRFFGNTVHTSLLLDPVSKLRLALADMHYSNGIWHRRTHTTLALLPLKQLAITAAASGSGCGRQICKSPSGEFCVDCVPHLLFGLCNIDARCQRHQRHFKRRDFTSLFIKLSALC